MNTAYVALLTALRSAPALGLPNYSLPFHLWVSESGGAAAAVLAQSHGGGIFLSVLTLPLILCPLLSCACFPSTFLCGYAVCSPPSTVVESFSLPFSSAQAAELYAITCTCILSQDQNVTIYTDSRYAFGVVHDFGGIWSQRGFVTSDNKPISHASLIEDLIRASFLPSRLAVVKVRAHQRGSNPDSIGNNAADSAARRGALHGPPCPFLDSSSFSCAALTVDCLPGLDLVDIQSSASPLDMQHWLSCGYDSAVVPFRDEA
ncbi:uncharacterized protein LOC119261952 [Pygocentrus nattereri]|uniref:uncharacterized protein LOC119261952 n=1 Tax=Pygocentrus nattereri TaxID=42514 RepID=UPI001891E8C9|nr:uncharacterized protein LOC119261952 [Pygocentrus nattereri]